MNLKELKAKAEAATPEACAPITYRPGSDRSWYPIHRPDCAWNTKHRPCDCDVHLRKGAVEAFSEAITPQVVLALIKAVEALNECDSLSPWEQVGDSFTEQCRECGSDRPRHYESRPAHFDFCPWPKLVKAREELEAAQ